jgi:teichuronic acid biosynthesis glycosyltransferase TuaG
MPPLVSVIVPAYNAAMLIGEALQSIQQQSYSHWQVIVVEDGTQDGTEQIVQAFAQVVGASKVHYLRHCANQGLSTARNTGIAAAKGEYIALLDHDDRWHPQHLAKLVDVLERTAADVGYAAAEFFEFSSHEVLGFHGPQATEWESFPHSLLNRNYIPVSSVVMRRQVPTQIGGFDVTLKRVEDLDYWLRCIEAGLKFAYVPEITNGYRQGNPQAMTANKGDILEWHARVLRKHAHLQLVSSTQRNRILARYHLGVVRRTWKNNPGKAWEFFYWSLRLTPIGSLAALQWVLMEAFGKERRYKGT